MLYPASCNARASPDVSSAAAIASRFNITINISIPLSAASAIAQPILAETAVVLYGGHWRIPRDHNTQAVLFVWEGPRQ